jgi:hypothetical protein
VKNCQTQGIGVPGNISFFDTLVSDDVHAHYVQDLQTRQGRSKFSLHAEFYCLQWYNHVFDSIVALMGLSREQAASELGFRGYDGAVNSIVALTGLSREQAASELACHAHDGAVNSIVALLKPFAQPRSSTTRKERAVFR